MLHNEELPQHLQSTNKGSVPFIPKAIAIDGGGQALLRLANVSQDVGVVDTENPDAFIAAAKTRAWDREKSVRGLA